MDAPSSSLELTSKYARVLRLPKPHSSIIVTCPRLEDAHEILPILNDVRVYPWMGAGLPYPHEQKHALSWLHSVKPRCDLGQEDLRVASTSESTSHSIRECPVRIIREVKENKEVYLGDCGITKWGFLDVVDKQQREQLKLENNAKVAGDSSIIWSIGYYLDPNFHGNGIMAAVISSLMSWAKANMNVHHMRTTAMEGNEASISVLKKNGFMVEKTLPDFAVKVGDKVGLHVLEWRASSW